MEITISSSTRTISVSIDPKTFKQALEALRTPRKQWDSGDLACVDELVTALEKAAGPLDFAK